MCLIDTIPCPDDRHGFKIFGFDAEERLTSAFAPSYKPGLFYRTNERTRTDTEDVRFFAFAQMRDAIELLLEQNHWNFVRGPLIILPVTLYQPVEQGYLPGTQTDLQCVSRRYPAYQSQEMEIHDSPEARKLFYEELIRADVERRMWNFSASLSRAYQKVLRLRDIP